MLGAVTLSHSLSVDLFAPLSRTLRLGRHRSPGRDLRLHLSRPGGVTAPNMEATDPAGRRPNWIIPTSKSTVRPLQVIQSASARPLFKLHHTGSQVHPVQDFPAPALPLDDCQPRRSYDPVVTHRSSSLFWFHGGGMN